MPSSGYFFHPRRPNPLTVIHPVMIEMATSTQHVEVARIIVVMVVANNIQ
ncbi:MAG: hypothetical protein AAF708_05020 [Deinococcota bacterium]